MCNVKSPLSSFPFHAPASPASPFEAFASPCYTEDMSVQIQPTPNPNAHKYVLPSVHFSAPVNVSSVEEAASHPLAARLFALANVYNVFLVQDFVTVNKVADAEWQEVDEKVTTIIEAFLQGRMTG